MFKAFPVQRIEVSTGEQKRRHNSAEEKPRFIALSMQPGYSVSPVPREYGITPSESQANGRWSPDKSRARIPDHESS